MLNFDYDNASGDSVAEYKGLTVKAVQDSDAGNPWLEEDGNVPLLYYCDGLTDCGQGYDLESVLASTRYFSDYQLGRKWTQLCKALDVDPAELDSELKAERKQYGGRLADYRRDALESVLADKRPSGWGSACDYFDALESLWRLAGVPALDFQRNGYSQGDSIRGLLVAVPEWQAKLGANYKESAELESQANLLGAWAFGDVYGFVIQADGDTLDSCWGYYGSDFQESGLAEAAKESADSILANAAKLRTDKLKQLIRNRVPVAVRAEILAEAPYNVC